MPSFRNSAGGALSEYDALPRLPSKDFAPLRSL